MLTTTRATIGTLLCAAATAMAGCGGGDGSAEPAADTQTNASPPRTADYQLARVGRLGLREAFLTLTGRSDGKTTAVVDFYVPRDSASRDDVYAIAVRGGTCDRPGAVQHDLGEQASGTTVLMLDASIDELADSLDSGHSTVTITPRDGNAAAWCGP